MSVVFTTGPRNGYAANRLEIHDLVKDEKFFSLYVQALRLMQNQPQDDPQSFFQISGIHGHPYTPWDGVKGQVAIDPNGDSGGYCTHNSVLFPTWHRPYVALFEQVVQQHAAKIATTYEVDTAAWMTAARNLRQPFWDWAKYPLPPDEVISLQQVSITGPKGRKIVVGNPLYSYVFHPVDPSFPNPFNIWKSTFRYPTAEATDDVSARLRNQKDEVAYKTYNMLTRTDDWFDFSNTRPNNTARSTSNSIEAIHDSMHFNIGGGANGSGSGHMSNVAMAAFDPIFYLHHCNVDRLLSLWSALNPGVWVSEGTSDAGTFTIASNVPVDQETPLTPFRNSPRTFWPSSAIKDTGLFGYTYPDFNELDTRNPQTLRTTIGNRINELYGWAISSGASASGGTASGGTVSGGSTVQATASPQGCPHLGVYDWTARVQFKKYEVGQSFCVALFLGAVPEDPKQWLISNNYAGAHYAFVNSQAGSCTNCVNQGDIVIEGFVHLNSALARLSGLGSLDPNMVEPYLKKELQWHAQKADGEPIDLRSLEVTVFSTPLSYPSGAMFPVCGERRHCGDITHGRPGGCRQL